MRWDSLPYEFPAVLSAVTPEESRALYDLATVSLGPVLEMGSQLGASTVVLARGAHEPMHAVDGDHGTIFTLQSNLARYGVHERVNVHVGRFEDILPFFVPARFALIFLDGDHEDAPVRRDLDLIRNLLAPGGTLAFHDYGRREWPGLTRMVSAEAERRDMVLEVVNTLAVLRPRITMMSDAGRDVPGGGPPGHVG